MNKERLYPIGVAFVFGVLFLLVVAVSFTNGFANASLGKTASVKHDEQQWKIFVYPPKYALTMSSTPGIRLLAQYAGGDIEYSASSGQLLTWNSTDGKISEKGSRAKVPPGTPVYWSPLARNGQFHTNTPRETSINITVWQNGTKAAKKLVTVHFDSSSALFTVQSSADVVITESLQPSFTIEEAVSRAVLNQEKSYLAGEAATEGHIILDTEERNGQIKVYTISSFGWFAFENGIFTTVSGCGAIPTVMTFSRNESGAYVLSQYQEPQDGAGYLNSVKKMFPRKLWTEVLTEGKHYPELAKQKEEQAAAYLNFIGREAEVSECPSFK